MKLPDLLILFWIEERDFSQSWTLRDAPFASFSQRSFQVVGNNLQSVDALLVKSKPLVDLIIKGSGLVAEDLVVEAFCLHSPAFGCNLPDTGLAFLLCELELGLPLLSAGFEDE